LLDPSRPGTTERINALAIQGIDLNDLGTFEAGIPHDQFKRLRNEAPVYRHEGAGNEEDFWCITKHADLKYISKRPLTFSSEQQGALFRDPDAESLPMLQQIMLNMDPPRHRIYRAIINKAFTPRMVVNMEARVDKMIEQIINRVCERGACDFVDDLAAPLPMQVICEMVGVPEEDRRSIYELGNRMVGFDDPELNPDGTWEEPQEDSELMGASAEMFLYAAKLKAKFQNSNEDNLATALLNAEVDGQKLTDMEFNSFFLILAIAGNETTRTVTSNGMIQLIRHPDQRDRLLKDPSLLNTAVEEILRFEPAVSCFRRTAMKDVEIRGTRIAEGDKIMLWYPAVNRDEEVFDDPDTFDIGRNPNDHLSFGIGEHFCLGSNLARMELRKIFAALMKRLPDIEFASPPRRLRSNFVNGVKEMQVTFKPSAPIHSH
jgi:cholest-4-en-3-one 26-monooxygenase